MKFDNMPNRCVHIDGQEIWISRSVTVLPVLFFIVGSKGYVPLGKRGDGMPDERGKWALPGGYLDYNETTGEAAIRETWEELGLNLLQLQDDYRCLGSLDQPYHVFSQPIRKQNVTLRFPLMFFLESKAELPKLQPQVSKDEVLQAQWFSLEKALTMALAFNHEVVMQHCLDTYYKGYYDGQSILIPGSE
ncbi:MAG: NUDIX hydrolase [Leptolyngbyaceae cyanobacterium MO_188.B28]|nr:NUDIX hydrolase [Leptolyngbyaceae cyanobacterium MO_188.B28]